MIEKLVNMTFEKDIEGKEGTLFGVISWCLPDSLSVTALLTWFEGGTIGMRSRSAVHLTAGFGVNNWTLREINLPLTILMSYPSG